MKSNQFYFIILVKTTTTYHKFVSIFHFLVESHWIYFFFFFCCSIGCFKTGCVHCWPFINLVHKVLFNIKNFKSEFWNQKFSITYWTIDNIHVKFHQLVHASRGRAEVTRCTDRHCWILLELWFIIILSVVKSSRPCKCMHSYIYKAHGGTCYSRTILQLFFSGKIWISICQIQFRISCKHAHAKFKHSISGPKYQNYSKL